MLEKIRLPPKPALRGSNWAPDASHCQGCSSQFTFLNRKHHCIRCGGLFCGTCTQHRMILRVLGDSPVRICEPCKKLEEAEKFELRQGRRTGRASVKSTPRYEDEVLSQILGNDGDKHFSSGKLSTNDAGLSGQRSVGSASSSSIGYANYDDEDIQKVISNDNLGTDMGSTTTTPKELRQQALEEKKKYKVLKGDGKSEEALRAFKRGKELERQADALEVQLRKARKRNFTSGNDSDMLNIGNPVEYGRKTKSLSHMGKEKDDIASELRELGWSDMDLHDEDKKSRNLSLEGELSSIIGENSSKTGEEKCRRADKTEVIVLKKKALMLKREGKLAEAKEELKRAKLLEKQLEEQELLAEAEDSDDELSALIRGMDDDKEEVLDLHEHNHGLEFDHFLGISDDLDSNFKVTDEDMMDPQLAAALESLGWTEPENKPSKSQPFDKEALLSDIQSLKREALNQKRAGNAAEAMAFLKKAKLLERDLNISGPEENNNMVQKSTVTGENVSSIIAGNVSDSIQLDERNTKSDAADASILAPKSRLTIQRELLSLKRKALSLRREGKLNEAEEELRKGAALEHQLMEMDKAPNLEASQRNINDNVRCTPLKHSDIHRDLPLDQGGEDDVTDKDMSDPSYLSLLTDLGWNDESNEISNSPRKPLKKDGDHFVPINDASLSQHSKNIFVVAPRKSKFEIQRELLGLKRKSLALRREGKTEEAEEVLKRAIELEVNMTEIEAPKKVQVEATKMEDKIFNPIVETAFEEGSDEVVSEEDMHDPSLNSMLIDLGWNDEELESVTKKEAVKEASSRFTHTADLSSLGSSSGIPITALRSKGDIQRELLVLKRKALSLRHKGEIEEAEEVLRMAESLEAQMEDFGAQNKESIINVSKDEKLVLSESSDLHDRPKDQEVAMELDKGSTSSMVSSSNNVAESLIGLERISNETSNHPFLRKTDNLIPGSSHSADEYHLSVDASSESPAKKIKAAETIGCSSSSSHSVYTLDLPTGDTQKQKEYNLDSANSSQASSSLSLDSSMSLSQDQRFKENVATQKIRESTEADDKPSIREPHVVNDHASLILDHKRKALALKREGKIAEAREELRRAKLLGKSLEDGSMHPDNVSTNIPSEKSHVVQKQDSSNVATKPLSGRDRFKLQQESLAHKRQALKLRRDGRMEEAEAEFERAKALETQLEELADHDSGKPSDGKLDGADDVTVEDFLDPQLLSALKAAGLEDVGVVSTGQQRQELVKPNVARTENSDQERIQLEERIKAEKTKAVNLKRSGKQAEALDALRRAKMHEKKLNSLISGRLC